MMKTRLSFSPSCCLILVAGFKGKQSHYWVYTGILSNKGAVVCAVYFMVCGLSSRLSWDVGKLISRGGLSDITSRSPLNFKYV